MSRRRLTVDEIQNTKDLMEYIGTTSHRYVDLATMISRLPDLLKNPFVTNLLEQVFQDENWLMAKCEHLNFPLFLGDTDVSRAVPMFATLVQNCPRLKKLHVVLYCGYREKFSLLSDQHFENTHNILRAFAKNQNGLRKEVEFEGIRTFSGSQGEICWNMAQALSNMESLDAVSFKDCESWFVKTIIEGVSANQGLRKVELQLSHCSDELMASPDLEKFLCPALHKLVEGRNSLDELCFLNCCSRFIFQELAAALSSRGRCLELLEVVNPDLQSISEVTIIHREERSLCFRGDVTAQDWASISQFVSGPINVLDFEGLECTADSARELGKFLSSRPVEHIRFEGCSFENATCEDLAQIFASNSLKEVGFDKLYLGGDSRNEVPSPQLLAILRGLQKGQSIERLSLSDFAWDEKNSLELTKTLKTCKHLVHLSVLGRSKPAAHLPKITQAIREGSTALSSLQLPRDRGQDWLPDLFEALRSNKHVKRLDFPNGMSWSGFQSVVDNLPFCHALEELKIGRYRGPRPQGVADKFVSTIFMNESLVKCVIFPARTTYPLKVNKIRLAAFSVARRNLAAKLAGQAESPPLALWPHVFVSCMGFRSIGAAWSSSSPPCHISNSPTALFLTLRAVICPVFDCHASVVEMPRAKKMRRSFAQVSM